MVGVVSAAAATGAGGGFFAPECMQPTSLSAYRWVLLVHSDWRWVVVVSGFVAVLSAAARLSAKQAWAPTGPKTGRFFSIALDVQILLGAALYLLLSPLSTVVLCSTGARLPPKSDAHFFGSIHPAIMVGAFIAVHISSTIVRRARSDAGHQRRAVIFYGLTLLIVLAGIPWWRPWLRL
jgi:hypothetical protein